VCPGGAGKILLMQKWYCADYCALGVPKVKVIATLKETDRVKFSYAKFCVKKVASKWPKPILSL
jgi:hypothetical protein